MERKTKSKVWTRTKYRKECDKLYSVWVRSIGRCEKCGKTTNLQCAHIYSRHNLHLRYDPKNAICLCYGCHLFWWHKNPLEAAEFIKYKYPLWTPYLEKEKNVLETNIDWPSIYTRLKKQVENL